MKVIVSFLVVTLMSGTLLAERKGDVKVIPPGEKPDESTTLKFDFVGTSLIVIPVFVNGTGPYRFLLDTGASMTVVTTALARKLNIHHGRSENLSSAAGNVPVNVRKVETLQVGEIRIVLPEVAIADFDMIRSLKLDGILGGDRLKSFTVSIDYPKKLVRIERA